MTAPPLVSRHLALSLRSIGVFEEPQRPRALLRLPLCCFLGRSFHWYTCPFVCSSQVRFRQMWKYARGLSHHLCQAREHNSCTSISFMAITPVSTFHFIVCSVSEAGVCCVQVGLWSCKSSCVNFIDHLLCYVYKQECTLLSSFYAHNISINMRVHSVAASFV